MLKQFSVLVLIASVLAGCGGNRAASPDASEGVNPLIPEERESLFRRPPEVFEGTTVDTITDLSVERVPGGIIIRSTGRVAQTGAYDVRLTPLDPEGQPVEGVLSFALQAERTEPIPGSPGVRNVIAAVKRTDQQLGDTRTIRVEGLQNTLDRRR